METETNTFETAPASEAEPMAEAEFDGAAFQSLFDQIIGESHALTPEPATPEISAAEAEEDSAADVETEQPHFVPLIRPVSVSVPAGPTRSLWQQIARDHDLSDHQTLADCVDLLIEELDAMLGDAGIDLAMLVPGHAIPPLPEDEATLPRRLGHAGG